MSTIFTKIIQKELPSYLVYEDDFTYSFLNIRPKTLGHTLIIPKIEVDSFLDVPEPYYSRVFKNAKFIAAALKEATGCVRIGASIEGFEVPHFHYHLIPLHTVNDMHKAWQELKEESMREIHKNILASLEKYTS